MKPEEETEFAELAKFPELAPLNVDARDFAGIFSPQLPLMTKSDVANYCIAVHVGAGYHSEHHASEYRRLIAAACQAAADVLKEVGHLSASSTALLFRHVHNPFGWVTGQCHRAGGCGSSCQSLRGTH